MRSVLMMLILLGAGTAMAADDHAHESAHRSEAASTVAPVADHAHAATEEHGGQQHNAAAPTSLEPGHDEHGEHEGHEGHEADGVALDPAQRRMIGLRTDPLVARAIVAGIEAPGEARLNTYATAKVAPRITAQILRRHAYLGQHVAQGATLVTLSSVEMAAAQGDLRMAHREWERARRLGQKVVSERRYTEAKVAYEMARAKVLAYGMSEGQVAALLEGKSPATGEFVLTAPREGTVIADDFVEGDVVEPGRTLMTLTDESVLWVEARLTPEQAASVEIGTAATVDTPSGKLFGKVVQLSHVVDEATRTLGVRVEVENPQDRLHAGEFVAVHIDGNASEPVFTLPEVAVQRGPDGDWLVFVEEEPGHYLPREVELVRSVGDQAVVTGLPAGTQVVTRGAFFLQSELAKGGFDVHQH